MKRPSSASAPSAPEAEPDWARKVLQRRGVLLQGPKTPAAEVLCVDVRGTALLLTLLSDPQPAATVHPCQLQFADASGILQLGGTLSSGDQVRVNGVVHEALRFDVDPASTAHLNRRSSYRIGVTLKGELAILEPDELEGREETGSQGRLEALGQLIRARKRPCIVQDLSLGGARVAVPPPAPRAGQTALLDIALDRGDVLHNVAGTVVQGGGEGGRREFGAHARLRFSAMPGNAEARLARLISQVQLQTLRQGVRDRR